MTHWFPIAVSTYGAEIDRLFNIILVITGAIFVVVTATLLYFSFKYRHREGRQAYHIHGDMRVEAIWTLIPFLIVVGIAAISMGPWLRLRDVDRFPPAELEVRVMAKQFEWNVTYPGPDNVLDTADDFTGRNRLHIPVDRVVYVHLGADDVIHSFFLPEFRVKQDAMPGMSIPVWFEAIATGDYVLGCAELCGLGHYRMRGTVTVHEVDDFDRWLQSGGTLELAGNDGADGAATTRPIAAADADDHAAHTGHEGEY
ncbi:MAG: cytochrome c oxidase subunit II [Gemmatimonadota bacterium]